MNILRGLEPMLWRGQGEKGREIARFEVQTKWFHSLCSVYKQMKFVPVLPRNNRNAARKSTK